MFGTYLGGLLVSALIVWIKNGPEVHKLQWSYTCSPSDENAYRLTTHILKMIAMVVAWPLAWPVVILTHVGQPAVKLVEGTLRHSATIRQHRLDDKDSIRGGMSMVKPESECTRGRVGDA